MMGVLPWPIKSLGVCRETPKQGHPERSTASRSERCAVQGPRRPPVIGPKDQPEISFATGFPVARSHGTPRGPSTALRPIYRLRSAQDDTQGAANSFFNRLLVGVATDCAAEPHRLARTQNSP